MTSACQLATRSSASTRRGSRSTRSREAICVTTSDENPISNLTEATVEEIFAGFLTDWSEVPGAFVTGPIDLFDYEPSAPTQETFQSIFLGELLNISSSATGEPSEEVMRNAVAADKDGIGLARVGKTAGVNAVGYQGEPCTVQFAHTGLYGGTRNLWLVTKGYPSGDSLTFIDWIRESAAAQSIIESDWVTLL